jgi:dihydroorotate dehydrogenase electron transfer subunit
MVGRKIKKKVEKARIVSNNKIAPDHYVMEVASAYLARNSAPGQFVSVRVRENTTDPLLRIPLGIHSIGKRGIKLLYKVVGSGTSLLSSKKKGNVLDVLGPLGNGFDPGTAAASRNVLAVMVAGGHGVAPLYALAETFKKTGRKMEVFIGACEKKHLVCVEKFRKLGAKVHVATERGDAGYKGYVTELLKKHLKRLTAHCSPLTVYACGPRPMLAALSGDVAELNIPVQVSLDAYMACGIGACVGCAVRTVNGYKLVCEDGPVFDAREIDWKREAG